MQFIVYLTVLAVTIFGVALEWNALVEPSAATRRAMNELSHMEAPPSPPAVSRATVSAPPAVQHVAAPAAPPRAGAAAMSDQSSPATAAEQSATTGQGSALAQETEGNAEAMPRCDVNACADAYQSFRASDCSYQPYDGPRRLCTRGTQAAMNARADANAASFARCHHRACAEAYSSFNPADCTYQPLEGPRRVCEK